MFRQVLREEAERLNLEPPDGSPLAGMEAHFRLLLKWNRRLNLTSVRGERNLIRKHFLEPLQASRLLRGPGRLLDLGSGNGFPGVPLKLLRPRIDLRLVDSSAKRCSFLKELFRTLDWDVSHVIHMRVEGSPDLMGLGRFRYITMRGVRPRKRLLLGLLEALDPGGALILFLGMGQIPLIRKTLAGHGTVETQPLLGRSESLLAVVRKGDVPRGTP